jgi:hypothetical protein
VYGWLRLDRRGRWLIRMPDRNAAGAAAPAEPRFERVVNPAMIEFIGRNYTHDAEGRYFFQNGPQRVFVALECAPWIFRLDESGSRLVTHTDAPAGAPRDAYFDEQGGLILLCEIGIGAVLDRDLAALAERFSDEAGQPLDAEALMHRAQGDTRVRARMFNADIAIGAIRSGELAARFGFVARPAPPPGQPDC